jgi:hypothetical protein
MAKIWLSQGAATVSFINTKQTFPAARRIFAQAKALVEKFRQQREKFKRKERL